MSKQPKSSSTPLPQGSGGETQQAVSLLATLKPVQDFISDAYNHYKAIGLGGTRPLS